jgi:hypothetical protein
MSEKSESELRQGFMSAMRLLSWNTNHTDKQLTEIHDAAFALVTYLDAKCGRLETKARQAFKRGGEGWT